MKRFVLFALPFLLLAAGCQGPVKLPAINLTEPLDDSIIFGPGAGVAPGQQVTNATFSLGLYCDAVNEDAIRAQVRAVVGDTVGSMITLNRILLTGIVFSVRSGSLAGFESITVNITPAGGAPVPFGTITNETGLGSGFTITPDVDFDALALLGGANCLGITMTYTGTTPAKDLDLRLDAYVTVEAEASM